MGCKGPSVQIRPPRPVDLRPLAGATGYTLIAHTAPILPCAPAQFAARMQASEQDVPLRQDSGSSSNSPARWTTVGLVASGSVLHGAGPDCRGNRAAARHGRPAHSRLGAGPGVLDSSRGTWSATRSSYRSPPRLADAHGHAVLFRLSLVLFGVASVAVALSPDLPWLVGSRVVQAAGGGATIPIGLALATQAMFRATAAPSQWA